MKATLLVAETKSGYRSRGLSIILIKSALVATCTNCSSMRFVCNRGMDDDGDWWRCGNCREIVLDYSEGCPHEYKTPSYASNIMSAESDPYIIRGWLAYWMDWDFAEVEVNVR